MFTKQQAIDELAWRATPKPRAPREIDTGLASKASGEALRKKAGVKSSSKTKAAPKVTASSRGDALLKVKAQAAFKRAFDAADEGQKMLAGRRAYKAVFVKAAEKKAA